MNSVGRLSSVECYCVEEDRWKYVASTQHAICDHAGGTFRDKMFISGGFADALGFQKEVNIFKIFLNSYYFYKSVLFMVNFPTQCSATTRNTISGRNARACKQREVGTK